MTPLIKTLLFFVITKYDKNALNLIFYTDYPSYMQQTQNNCAPQITVS